MKPILLEDIALFRNISQLKMNPAHDHVSFTLTTPVRDENLYHQDIYLTDCRTSRTTRMTGSGKDGFCLWDDDETLLLMRPPSSGSARMRCTGGR